jgi:hypothetical protein
MKFSDYILEEFVTFHLRYGHHLQQIMLSVQIMAQNRFTRTTTDSFMLVIPTFLSSWMLSGIFSQRRM